MNLLLFFVLNRSKSSKVCECNLLLKYLFKNHFYQIIYCLKKLLFCFSTWFSLYLKLWLLLSSVCNNCYLFIFIYNSFIVSISRTEMKGDIFYFTYIYILIFIPFRIGCWCVCLCVSDTDSFQVRVSAVSVQERVRVHVPAPLDRNDGSFLVRFRLYSSAVSGLKVEVFHKHKPVAQSPYTLTGVWHKHSTLEHGVHYYTCVFDPSPEFLRLIKHSWT